jgi:hypothetical protein
VPLACPFGSSFWLVPFTCLYNSFFWLIHLACPFGSPFQLVTLVCHVGCTHLILFVVFVYLFWFVYLLHGFMIKSKVDPYFGLLFWFIPLVHFFGSFNWSFFLACSIGLSLWLFTFHLFYCVYLFVLVFCLFVAWVCNWKQSLFILWLIVLVHLINLPFWLMCFDSPFWFIHLAHPFGLSLWFICLVCPFDSFILIHPFDSFVWLAPLDHSFGSYVFIFLGCLFVCLCLLHVSIIENNFDSQFASPPF